MGLPEDIKRIIESEIESFSENLLDEVSIRLNLENKEEEEEYFQDDQYIDMFNGQKAIAVRIYEKDLNDYAEFLFDDGSFLKINLSNCKYKCLRLLTNFHTLFYDNRIDINNLTAYDMLMRSEFDRAIEIEYNTNSKVSDSINIYEYGLVAPPSIIGRKAAFTDFYGERADNVLHALISNIELNNTIHDIKGKVYIVDLRTLNKPSFEDLKKEIENMYRDDELDMSNDEEFNMADFLEYVHDTDPEYYKARYEEEEDGE